MGVGKQPVKGMKGKMGVILYIAGHHMFPLLLVLRQIQTKI